jgi:hypothetical protein
MTLEELLKIQMSIDFKELSNPRNLYYDRSTIYFHEKSGDYFTFIPGINKWYRQKI